MDGAVQLSDASRRDSGAPYLLVDARRRSWSLHDPIYQCDRSCIHEHAPWISRESAPLSILSFEYDKGIGIATPFVLTYRLDGAYAQFEAVIGIDDGECRPEPWSFEVYLDDVRSARVDCAIEMAVHVRVDTRGAREMVLVGRGRDELYVQLVDAVLEPCDTCVRSEAVLPADRRAMLEFDDRLVLECEALLTARAARRVSARLGPDDRPEAIGGFGRTTSSRGADMWASIGEPGDLLRWQTFVRRDGAFIGWVRVVSSVHEAAPDPGCYEVRIDGRAQPTRRGPHMIVERMPDDRFSDRMWGYLQFEVAMGSGVHEVEVVNAADGPLAVNRVVLVHDGPVAASLAPAAPPAPIVADLTQALRPAAGACWSPGKLADRHYVVAEDGSLFQRARRLGVFFAPDLHNYRDIDESVAADKQWFNRAKQGGKAFTLDLLKGRRIGRTYAEYLDHMLAAELPFTIHSLFSTDFDAALISAALHERVVREGGDCWQGFHTTEWTDHYNFSDEAKAEPLPATRAEAWTRARTWYQQRAAMHYDDVTAMCGSWRWDHYSGAWSGGRGIQDEPGPSPGAQLNSLFARGAARQYARMWHTEIAPGTHDGYCWVENDYMTREGPHDTRAHPHSGCSISWVRRILFMTYMWGSQSVWSEVPAFGTDATPDGRIVLSPMGEVIDEFLAFTATNPGRGVPYTPVGVMLDRMHGWSGRQLYPDRYPNLTWTHLQPDEGDIMKDAVFDLLYPGQSHTLNEHHALSATPFGDLFDIMLSDAGAEHLSTYPVLMLVGGLSDDMDRALTARLCDYVESGGTLLINVAQLAGRFDESFLGVCVEDRHVECDAAMCDDDGCTLSTGQPFSYRAARIKGATPLISTRAGDPLVTRREAGSGAIVLTLVPFLLQRSGSAVCFLPHLLDHLVSGLLPFRITGDVQYSVNRSHDAWLVTLLNHRGVYKLPTEPTMTDERQRQEVTVTLGEGSSDAFDWMDGRSLPVDGSTLTLEIPAGDLRIIRIPDP